MQNYNSIPNYMQQLQTMQNMLQQPQQAIAPQQTIQYTNGKSGAEAYQMAPNSSAILMDSSNPIFYLKMSDANGLCTIRTFEFKEKIEKKQEDVFASKEDVAKLENRLNELKGMIENGKSTHEPSRKSKQ